jgi:hypothetical protein
MIAISEKCRRFNVECQARFQIACSERVYIFGRCVRMGTIVCLYWLTGGAQRR